MLSRRILRVKVVKAVYAHLQTECDNIPTTEKNLIASIDKAYDLYFHMLSLLPELVRYAEARQEIARNKMLATIMEHYKSMSNEELANVVATLS